MVQIIIDKGLSVACPSILDIEPTMVNIPPEEPLEISWSNSRQEHVALSRHENRNFTLYVSDLHSSERATASLEKPLKLDTNLVGSARTALTNKKLYNWREFARDMGSTVTRNLVLKLAADDIRKGNKPKLAYVAKDILLDGVTPSNADTLLRLRLLRGF